MNLSASAPTSNKPTGSLKTQQKTMIKRLLTYLLILFVFASCGKEEVTTYTIKGKVSNEACDIVLFGLNNRFEKIDSIRTDTTGRFTYTIDKDTVVPFSLFLPDGEHITLFAEKGVTAELSYDSITKGWVVKGGPIQAIHDSISSVIESSDNVHERLTIIEAFIKSHTLSEINIELIRRYLVDIPGQNNTRIKATISKLSGVLQDNEYIAVTKKKITTRNFDTLHKLFPSFTYITADSCKKITLDTFKKKHLLITFWASWDKASKNGMQKLRNVKDSIKSENFEILNIALDHDTIAWKNALKEDSIIGYNVCDEMAWSSEVISKFDIDSLPYSLLISPYQRIIKYKIDTEKDIALIDSLTKKHDKSLEERRKREELEKKKKNNKNKK